MSDLTERLDRLAKGIEITEVLWPGTLLKYPDAGEAALRIAELEAAVTDCHAGHTAIERGYLARIAELEAALQQISHEERQGMDYMEGYASLSDQIARKALGETK